MLGQNFLVDSNIAEKIVDKAEIQEGERILEIGPGRGILTDILVEKGNLLAVRKTSGLQWCLSKDYQIKRQLLKKIFYIMTYQILM